MDGLRRLRKVGATGLRSRKSSCGRQRFSACNASHGYGLHPYHGRGAPEIDIVETMAGVSSMPYNGEVSHGCEPVDEATRAEAARAAEVRAARKAEVRADLARRAARRAEEAVATGVATGPVPEALRTAYEPVEPILPLREHNEELLGLMGWD